ncbi:MAG: hypothetical protein ACPG4W_06210 [Flavobacteriales bacterium]
MRFHFKFLSLTVLFFAFSLDSFSIDLRPDYYAAYHQFVSGNREELQLETIPFSEAATRLHEHDLIIESEVLSGLLMGDTSYFFMYGVELQHEELDVFANQTKLQASQINLINLSDSLLDLQAVRFAIPNAALQPKQAVRFQISSQSGNAKLILQALSNRIKCLDLGIKTKTGKRELFIESNLVEVQELRLITDFGSQLMHFKPGFQMQSMVLEGAEFETGLDIEWRKVNKKLGREFIDLEPILAHQIYINILADSLLHEIPDLPYELQNPTEVLVWNEDLDRPPVNFSVHPEDENRIKKLASLDQMGRVRKSALRRKTYPGRSVMNSYLDYGIDFLAWMPSDRNFYPKSVQNQQLAAEFYEDGDRKLLLYKALNLGVATDEVSFRKAILCHLKKLKSANYSYKSSALMFGVKTSEEARALQSWLANWNTTYSSTGLRLSHLADFFEAFRRQHFSSIPTTDQVQQARKLDNIKHINPHPLKELIAENQSDTLSSEELRCFNPTAKTFSGLVHFYHRRQGEWTSGQLETGERLPVQEMDKGEYWIYIPEIQGFSSVKIKLSDTKVKPKSKSKFKLNVKKKGIVWKFGNQWLSKPNRPLISPIVFNDLERERLELLSSKKQLKSGSGLFKTLTTEWLYAENLVLKTVDYVFDNQNVIVKRLYWKNVPKAHSLHFDLASMLLPHAYSLDLEFKADLGYKRHQILNTFSSKTSVFKYTDIKLQIESSDQLHWQYNFVNYRDLNLDSKEKIKHPARFINYIPTDSMSFVEYQISILSLDEKAKQSPYPPFVVEEHNRAKDFGFSIDNVDVQVVDVISTPNKPYTLLLLKNTSDELQNAKISTHRRRSKIYTALFSGKKTGIVKHKLTLAPKSTQLIRVQL